ncbi:asparagine synthase (glutamine-hydrolyzing) [Alicyclobacillus shizuokensis]|uniref:asparagine synthase (glutamine-hydrolyzing) n=1 Tax=Alicyclobacillus shizuokensis TaxID=392014 RepID=UPI000836A18E|nr:asparagine synthase (glutamine-hydrolyzing) [Alicyclobacillus shizuokensis]MCL6626846.1 asparagine synthase (glutamine-hydrolyzing) [Alicyclobacillus shizuokensis]
MCGIAGWVDWERDLTRELETIRAMGETMACRGPDASDVWLSQSAAFAHRRLIVVDPEGGRQPMTRRFGERSYTITYNGELYNTDEVRQELTARGYRFQSYSDTEVVLLSYVEWGPAALEKLNGIFAYAIWDEAARTLFMARDRLGVKPLFYAQRGRGLLFASELKGLLANPLVDPVVDAEGLAEVFLIGPGRTPGHGVFHGVKELRAGHYLLANEGYAREHPYWQLTAEPHTDDAETTVAKVRELLVDTVNRQLVSDVPVCTFLSGGVDSSAVSAIAAEAYRRRGLPPLDTYSIDFVDMAENFEANSFQTGIDAPWARRVSEFIGSRHHPVVFGMEEQLQHLFTPIAARDLPGMYDIDTSLYLFCKAIKQDATVALSGEAADEVFGGYPWFHREEALTAHTFPWSLQLDERVRVMSPELQTTIRPVAYVADRYRDALTEVPKLPGENTREARVREIGYLSITRFLATLLDRKDRMSMATGLEVRVPFCDHRLVQYVFNIPWHLKTIGGQVKGVLRAAMRGYLPDDVLSRKKSPYPSDPNPRYLETTRSLALAMLEDANAPIRPLIDTDAIRQLAASSYKKGEHHPWYGQIAGTAQMFHYLVQIDRWLRDYKVRIV